MLSSLSGGRIRNWSSLRVEDQELVTFKFTIRPGNKIGNSLLLSLCHSNRLAFPCPVSKRAKLPEACTGAAVPLSIFGQVPASDWPAVVSGALCAYTSSAIFKHVNTKYTAVNFCYLQPRCYLACLSHRLGLHIGMTCPSSNILALAARLR